MYSRTPDPEPRGIEPTGELGDLPHPFALAAVIGMVWLFGIARIAVPAAALTKANRGD